MGKKFPNGRSFHQNMGVSADISEEVRGKSVKKCDKCSGGEK